MKKFLTATAIGAIISTFLALLFFAGVFKIWQEKLSDNLFLPRKVGSDIIIIAIDDKSIQEIGRWPWDRSVHAKLIAKINPPAGGPKAIGVDISFFEKSDPESDLELETALTENIILASEIVNGQELKPIFGSARSGITNTIIDSDGVTRRVPTKSFASEITRSDLAGENLRINFIGPPGSFTTYSFVDIYKDRIDLQTFNNKVVLIGATAPDLHDNQIVPTSGGTPMAGVEIHANTIQTILDNNFLLEEKTFLTILTILLLGISLTIIQAFSRIRIGLTTAIVAVIVYFLYAIFSFDRGIIRNLIYPPLVVITSFISVLVYKYATEARQKRFLRRAFSYYVSPQVINEIVAHPEKLKLGGEKKVVTILFSDIQGFTSISESMEAEKLTSTINEYLNRMTAKIFENNGLVDKFIGDAIMAFWGAPLSNPNHALDACRAAIAMQKIDNKNLLTRIGINTGEVVVGNIGSSARFDYSVLGDAVNIASRLEGLNKEYKTKILISQSTYELVYGKVKAKLVDSVTVRGKTKPIKVYELISLRG